MEKHHETIRESGFELFGISVDTSEESAKFRSEEGLSFELLADVERATIRQWDILNAKERGGIAFPNVYVVERDKSIIFHSSDGLASRVNPGVLLEFLKEHNRNPTHRLSNHRRKLAIPTWKDLLLGYPKKWGWLK